MDYTASVEGAQRHVSRSVDVLYQHAEKVFETQELIIDIVDRATQGLSIEDIQKSESLHRLLKDLDGRYPPIGPVWVFGPHGEQAASSRFFPVPPVQVDDRDYYRALRDGDVTFVTEAYRGKLINREMFNMARRLAPRDSLNGVILVSAFVDYYRDFFAQILPEPDAVASLVRTDGVQLIRWPALDQPIVFGPESVAIKALSRADQGTFTVTAVSDGIQRLYAFKRLRNYPVFVTAGVSLDTVRQAWWHQVQVNGLMAALTAALLTALTVLASWRMTQGELARIAAEQAAEVAEAESRRSEDRFRAAQEAALDGFVILDPIRDAAGTVIDCRFVYANPVTLRNARTKPEDMAGKTLCDLFPTSGLPGGLLERHAQVADSGEPAQFDLYYEDGGIAGWFRNRVVKVGDYIAATFSDITEEVAAREAAEAASRAKSQFFASASHDLRQPLQALRLFMDVLAGQETSPTVQRAITGAGQALKSAEGLLHSLLDVARIEAGAVRIVPQPIPLNDLFARLAMEFAQLAERKGIIFVARPSPLWVQSDPQALERILRNLATNAVRHTSQGGVLLGCRRRGDSVIIEVWDTGEGIPAAQLDHIWQEFVQLANPSRDRKEGLGLGLAIVKKLALALGHRVEVASRLGKGTVFRVAVPLAPTSNLGSLLNNESVSRLGRKTENALIP